MFTVRNICNKTNYITTLTVIGIRQFNPFTVRDKAV